jgi:glutamine synthetase
MDEKIEKITKRMKADNIKFIRLQFVDLHGIPKNVSSPCKLGNLEDLFTNGILFD